MPFVECKEKAPSTEHIGVLRLALGKREHGGVQGCAPSKREYWDFEQCLPYVAARLIIYGFSADTNMMIKTTDYQGLWFTGTSEDYKNIINIVSKCIAVNCIRYSDQINLSKSNWFKCSKSFNNNSFCMILSSQQRLIVLAVSKFGINIILPEI